MVGLRTEHLLEIEIHWLKEKMDRLTGPRGVVPADKRYEYQALLDELGSKKYMINFLKRRNKEEAEHDFKRSKKTQCL